MQILTTGSWFGCNESCLEVLDLDARDLARGSVFGCNRSCLKVLDLDTGDLA